jgi:drug/metabolite transporter (DMT)-like permease
VTSGQASPRLLGAGLIVIAASCFGTLGPLARFAAQAGVGSLSLVTWRAALGGLCMVSFIGLRVVLGHRPFTPVRELPRRDRWSLVSAAIANTVLNLSIFVAFERVSIALTLLIFYLYPTLVALASVVWFGDRLDRIRWGALATSLVGSVLVVAGAGSLGRLDPVGIGLAFVGAVAQAFYVLSARHGFSRVPGPQAAAATMLLAALFYTLAAMVVGQATVLVQPLTGAPAAVPVLLAGVIGAAVPTLCFITGIRLLGAPRAAILSTLEPVVGVGLAALLLGEQPALLQIVGGLLIVGAGVLLQVRAPDELAEHEAVPVDVATEGAGASPAD